VAEREVVVGPAVYIEAIRILEHFRVAVGRLRQRHG
jgi:hypothetical protein